MDILVEAVKVLVLEESRDETRERDKEPGSLGGRDDNI